MILRPPTTTGTGLDGSLWVLGHPIELAPWESVELPDAVGEPLRQEGRLERGHNVWAGRPYELRVRIECR